MDYRENFFGIRYRAKRGETLEVRASVADFDVHCANGVLNIKRKGAMGRTAVFVEDCDFCRDAKEWLVKIRPGTPSYMKELAKVRPLSVEECQAHGLDKLW